MDIKRNHKIRRDTKPKISVCVPIYDMKDGDKFLWRLINSLAVQTFKDWELVITKEGKMAENVNAGIRKAKGEIIKFMFMDDYFFGPESLQNLVDNFKGGWLATGCLHDKGEKDDKGEKVLFTEHLPSFDGIPDNQNTIGSPSVVAVENKDPLLFDENMSWLLDLDYYQRLYKRYGLPTLIDTLDTIIGVGFHQMTNILTNEDKINEQIYLKEKHDK